MSAPQTPEPLRVEDTTVDLLVIGSGTGMATALAAHERGLSVAIAEKTVHVGGSTARSGGAFWIPANPVLKRDGAIDSEERGAEYVEAVVAGSSPRERWQPFLDHGAETVRMLERTTPLKLFWAKGYSDYHPEKPGGSAAGRSVESRAFNLSKLGSERARFQPATMEAPLPMPITGADYKWLNLMTKKPSKGVTKALKRVLQGIGGKVVGREYVAGGQAIAGGMYAGLIAAGVPIWTETALTRLVFEGDRVTGAVLTQRGREVTVTARYGVVLAAGGFDHDMAMRQQYQSPSLVKDVSLGAVGNTGEVIRIAAESGAALDNMDQSWWFPAVEPVTDGAMPSILLAERSLPGSFMIDGAGKRFINESTDYMTFGQTVLRRERDGDPVGAMWLVFDQTYRDSYVFAGGSFPRMPLPKEWYEAGIAHKASTPAELAHAVGVPESTFEATVTRFNANAGAGTDEDFGRGNSAYDRYYGDPTVTPNPNLRPLDGRRYYAVKVVLSDLGTCGGVVADGRGRVLTDAGEPIEGLYAQGNTAANVFGAVYPGAGATIGQGLVFGYIIAADAAERAAAA